MDGTGQSMPRRINWITILGGILIVALLVWVGYKFRGTNNSLPAKNYSIEETKSLLLPHLKLEIPNVQSSKEIEYSYLPKSLGALILPEAKEIVVKSVRYETSQSGFLINYRIDKMEFNDFLSQSSSLYGWENLFGGGSANFGIIELQSLEYFVRVSAEKQNNGLNVEIQTITK